jgi:peptidoglycan hydrolase CwlO-like protein
MTRALELDTVVDKIEEANNEVVPLEREMEQERLQAEARVRWLVELKAKKAKEAAEKAERECRAQEEAEQKAHEEAEQAEKARKKAEQAAVAAEKEKQARAAKTMPAPKVSRSPSEGALY